ncbi:DUF6326 family protein [Brevundimonas sp. TWP2-3-2]|uniref:DUF6326 family protein n=1 Tax=unclassified Brevundimonas TaxID=2622653 RepID=UPI003CF1B403
MTDLDSKPVRLHAGLALSLLWATLMGLYIYNDYFSLYMPGTIEEMAAGKLGPLGQVNDAVMVAVSAMLAIPALMIFLSSALPRAISRWTNVLLGVVYTAIQVLTVLGGSRPFYLMVVALEVLVTLTIVAYALRWPREH